MTEQTVHYDLVILGSGQAGNPLADAFHKAGKRVAMVERALVGGTCVNYGCTPTKTMVASAEVAYTARQAAAFGIHTGEITVDMQAVVARKNRIIEESRANNLERFSKGVTLFRGIASFVGPKSIHVALNQGGDATLTAERIVIDTGLSPQPPDIQGIADVPTLDNASIMQLDHVPEHLLILGGGYIGLEFGQMFRRFGAQVTILDTGSQLLEREDPDIAYCMADILREDGIDIRLNTKALSVTRTGSQIHLAAQHEGTTEILTASHLLVATGRKPNTQSLNLPAAGISTDKHGFIQVDEGLETNIPGIFAVGDVKGGPAFTHIAYDDYRILNDRLLQDGTRTTTGRPVPYCVYTDPQLGRIGLSETEAKAQNLSFRVATIPMSRVARADETGQTRGLMKALIDPATRQILGAAILGAQGGEIMAMLQIAMMGRLPYTALRDAILAHPTFAESLNSLFMSLDKD